MNSFPSPLLIDFEAAAYLRLDVGREPELAVKALNRLVDSKLLRPCLVGKHRRYWVGELERFLRDQTERYGLLHP